MNIVYPHIKNTSRIINYAICFLIVFVFLSCKKNDVEGIQIGQDLYIGQSLEENRNLVKLITKTLNKDSNALSGLTEFWCGGGAGCYDLGIITSEIVYKINEPEFIKLASKLDSEQKNRLRGLLQAGLEYGYEPSRKIEIEFPNLNVFLIE
jgi:hypothetical protein